MAIGITQLLLQFIFAEIGFDFLKDEKSMTRCFYCLFTAHKKTYTFLKM